MFNYLVTINKNLKRLAGVSVRKKTINKSKNLNLKGLKKSFSSAVLKQSIKSFLL